MKLKITSLAAASLFTVAAAAHAQTTGVSHPEELNDNITTTTATAPKPAKPSPAIPVTTSPAATAAAATSAPAQSTGSALYTHSAPATPETAASYSELHHAKTAAPVDDANEGVANADKGMVVAISSKPNELPEGTLLRAALDETLSTGKSRAGDHFSARLTRNVERNGVVLIPAGSVVRGRITEVRAGHGFRSSAMIRLLPDTVTLPDGIPYPLEAQIIDLAPSDNEASAADAHVGSEGQIVGNQHAKAKAAAVGLSTGGAAAAGALFGGVGAIVGAGIGAGASLIVLSKQDHEEVLPEGTVLVLNLGRSLFLNENTLHAQVQ